MISRRTISQGDLAALRETAEEAALLVGPRIQSALASREVVSITHKGPVNLVTEIDLWSEETIVEHLEKRTPGVRIVAEERADNSLALADTIREDLCWVIDPLDGTTNFANGVPHVGVSIALLSRGERLVGVVYDPMREELYSAARGAGAVMNGTPIKTATKQRIIDAVIATGVPYDRQTRWDLYRPPFETMLLRCRDLRRFGAATLDQCWVANGRFDAFFEFGLAPWDVAAGSLIVEEAGGIATNLVKSPFSVCAGFFMMAGREIAPEMIALLEPNIA